jgi:hypothetical protein
MSSIDTEVNFNTWLAQLKARFIAKGGMTDEEAHNYVYDNRNDWREYYVREDYVDEFTAEDAADEDMTHWGD